MSNAYGYLKVISATPVILHEGTESEYAYVHLETAEGPMIRPLFNGESEIKVAAELLKAGYTDDHCTDAYSWPRA